MIKETLDLLGYRARDKASGYVGLVEAVQFDLYGCVQATLMPGTNAEGTLGLGETFDVNRIEKPVGDRVMVPPDFEAHGGTAELDLLGYAAKDKVTKFTGVRTVVAFDLYGCVLVALRPPVTRDSRLPNSQFFHASRLTKVKGPRVMAPPDYASMGAPETHPHGPAKRSRRASA
jgi:hypothetical protein